MEEKLGVGEYHAVIMKNQLDCEGSLLVKDRVNFEKQLDAVSSLSLLVHLTCYGWWVTHFLRGCTGLYPCVTGYLYSVRYGCLVWGCLLGLELAAIVVWTALA